MDQTNRLTNIPYNYYIEQEIIENEENINSNASGISNNSNTLQSQLALINSNTSNIAINTSNISINTSNIDILDTNIQSVQQQVIDQGTSFQTLALVVNGDAQINSDLFIGQNLMNVEQSIINIDQDLGNLIQSLEEPNEGGFNLFDIFGAASDFLGFITDMAIGATLAGYFSSQGLKDQKLLNDLVDNALDNDWTGEDEFETEDNQEKDKNLWDIHKIYKRPFSVVNKEIYSSNPLRYTTKISGIDQYSVGFLGNNYFSPDTLIGCSSNISYNITADNTFFDNLAFTEHHKDTLIYRDGLQGVKSELFCDYIFVGASNLDPINVVSPQNDYTYQFRVNGDTNLQSDLYMNDIPYIINSNDYIYQQSLKLYSLEPTITFRSLSNSNDNQPLLLCQNSGQADTLMFRRDITDAVGSAKPNFIWSIGSNTLTDFMTFKNNGEINIATETTINAYTNIFGHRHGSEGIITDKSVYQVKLDQDGNGFTIMSLETLGGVIFYRNLNLQQQNIFNIGTSNFNLNDQLIALNSKTINLDSSGQIDYSNILNSIDKTQLTNDLTTLSNKTVNLDSNGKIDYSNILNAINKNDLDAQLDLLDQKTLNLDSNGYLDYQYITNAPSGSSITYDINMNTNNITNIGLSNYNLNTSLTDLYNKTQYIDTSGNFIGDIKLTNDKSIYTNRITTKQFTGLDTNYITIDRNSIYHNNSNLFGSLTTTSGSTKLTLDTTNKIGTAPGANIMYLESDDLIIQHTNGSNIMEFDTNYNYIKCSKLVRSEAGLSNFTELYNGIYCPLSSNQTMRFTDYTFNNYMVVNPTSNRTEFPRPVYITSNLQANGMYDLSNNQYFTFNTDLQMEMKQDLRFDNVADIVCSFYLNVYNTAKTNLVRIDPNTFEINNIQKIEAASNTQAFEITNQGETRNIMQIDTVNDLKIPYTYIRNTGGGTGYTGAGEGNALLGILLSSQVIQSEFNGVVYDMIGWNNTNKSFSFKKIGVYVINVNIFVQNNQTSDNGVGVYLRKAGTQLRPEYQTQLRTETTNDRGRTISFNRIEKIETGDLNVAYTLNIYRDGDIGTGDLEVSFLKL